MPNLMHDPAHADSCAGCYEVDTDIWIHPPRNGGPASLRGSDAKEPEEIGGSGFVTITLSDEEISAALSIARQRDQNAQQRGRKAVNKIAQGTAEALVANQRGAMGEAAFALWQKVQWKSAFWDGHLRTGSEKPADFGNTDVKTSALGSQFLLLQEHDPDDRLYVLALADVGQPHVMFVGWIEGFAGKQSEFYGDPRNTGRACYWIPRAALHPIATYPGVKKEKR